MSRCYYWFHGTIFLPYYSLILMCPCPYAVGLTPQALALYSFHSNHYKLPATSYIIFQRFQSGPSHLQLFMNSTEKIYENLLS